MSATLLNKVFQIPERFFTSSENHVLQAIAWKTFDDKKAVKITQHEIKSLTKLSRRTIQRAIKVLQEKQILVAHRPKLRSGNQKEWSTNSYTINESLLDDVLKAEKENESLLDDVLKAEKEIEKSEGDQGKELKATGADVNVRIKKPGSGQCKVVDNLHFLKKKLSPGRHGDAIVASWWRPERRHGGAYKNNIYFKNYLDLRIFLEEIFSSVDNSIIDLPPSDFEVLNSEPKQVTNPINELTLETDMTSEETNTTIEALVRLSQGRVSAENINSWMSRDKTKDEIRLAIHRMNLMAAIRCPDPVGYIDNILFKSKKELAKKTLALKEAEGIAKEKKARREALMDKMPKTTLQKKWAPIPLKAKKYLYGKAIATNDALRHTAFEQLLNEVDHQWLVLKSIYEATGGFYYDKQTYG